MTDVTHMARLPGAGALVLLACLLGGASAAPAAAPYQRPSASLVREAAKDILSSERFAPPPEKEPSLAERIGRWIARLLGRLFFQGSTPVANVVYGALLIGAGLLVVALLVHLGLSLARNWRPRQDASAPGVPHFRPRETLGYEELCQLMAQLRAQGRFYDAVRVMMVALLRRLEQAGRIRFRKDKTNGEYVQEYPPAPERDTFTRFVRAFDLTVYAGAACRQQDFEAMDELYRTVQQNVPAKL